MIMHKREKEIILIVDDEEDILEFLRYNLEREGYRVVCARDGSEAIEMARGKSPDLIVLDLMLPEIDGFEVCKRLKLHKETEDIPIIMLTAKAEETDIVVGLEIGADDYITKPFSPKVLIARIRDVLRRRKNIGDSKEKVIKLNELTIDPIRHEVLVDGEELHLTYSEFKILYLLASEAGRVFTRYQIVDAVRGKEYSVTERAVDVQIVGLRKKLGKCGRYIETVRGIGYRFKG